MTNTTGFLLFQQILQNFVFRIQIGNNIQLADIVQM